jgi:hypothetical protein
VRLVFTRHARKRILERAFSVDEVQSAAGSATVVEQYPDDTLYPSRLVLGWAGSRPLHLVLAGPTPAGDTVVVTLYEPDPTEWEAGFTRRRTKRSHEVRAVPHGGD